MARESTTIVNAIAAQRGMEYLKTLPAVVPADRVLVHNQVRPTRRLGSRGFRAWLSAPHAGLEACPCAWAPELGHQHFRVRKGGR